MPSVFSVYVHHGFRGACEYLLSNRSTIAKHPPEGQVRFVRVRKAKVKRGSVYQVVEKHKDRHRRTVKRYRKVDDGGVFRDVNSPDERVTVKGDHKHEEKKSPRVDRKDCAEESESKNSRQRKKVAKKPNFSKSCRDATPSRGTQKEHARHSKPSRQKQNVEDTWSSTHGTVMSRSIRLQSDYTHPRDNDKGQHSSRRMLRVQATVPSGSEPSEYSSKTGRCAVRIVKATTAQADVKARCLDSARSQQEPIGPFQQPDMSNYQSRSLMFGNDID